MKISTSARIAPTTEAPLSRDQKTFNSLIRKIEAQRARLASWEEAITRFKQQYFSDLHPLRDEEMDLQLQFARVLDQAHGKKGLTKSEKKKLAEVIVELVAVLLESRDDEEIKILYNKYSQSDFDAEEAERMDAMKSMLEGVLGMDLGDDVDMRSPEDVLRQMEAQFHARQEEERARQASRKKTSRQQAREERLAAEEKQLSQSIREVYRKLASSLHPDREPDPEEKQRKTELMQRANEAYEKGNLLQLLELQLQLEHIDQSHLAAITPERLKHYIKILKGQQQELEMENQRIETEFAAQFNLPPFRRLDPKDLPVLIQDNIRTTKADIRNLKADLEVVGDTQRLKVWLKSIGRAPRNNPDDWLF